jgi:thioredoxin-dependent peroxiredoxin
VLEVGQIAPEFALVDQDGISRSLADAQGKWLVLFFYPRDDTAGCTKEACAFRDGLPRFEGLDAVVWGVSADDAKSHRKFVDKYGLNFPLLVDPEKQVLEGYGAWVEKRMYGKTYMGVQRITYLIDPKGVVAYVWPKVQPEAHADEVAAALEALRG